MATEIILRLFHCKRCRKGFHSAQEHPKRCGKCKSPYWDAPRVNARKGPKRSA